MLVPEHLLLRVQLFEDQRFLALEQLEVPDAPSVEDVRDFLSELVVSGVDGFPRAVMMVSYSLSSNVLYSVVSCSLNSSITFACSLSRCSIYRSMAAFSSWLWG